MLVLSLTLALVVAVILDNLLRRIKRTLRISIYVFIVAWDVVVVNLAQLGVRTVALFLFILVILGDFDLLLWTACDR